jgi:hypothetical protein
MKLPRRQFLHLAVGAAAMPAVSPIARAQSYPSRPNAFPAPAMHHVSRSRSAFASFRSEVPNPSVKQL